MKKEDTELYMLIVWPRFYLKIMCLYLDININLDTDIWFYLCRKWYGRIQTKPLTAGNGMEVGISKEHKLFTLYVSALSILKVACTE